jgi:hypothetical protein
MQALGEGLPYFGFEPAMFLDAKSHLRTKFLIG